MAFGKEKQWKCHKNEERKSSRNDEKFTKVTSSVSALVIHKCMASNDGWLASFYVGGVLDPFDWLNLQKSERNCVWKWTTTHVLTDLTWRSILFDLSDPSLVCKTSSFRTQRNSWREVIIFWKLHFQNVEPFVITTPDVLPRGLKCCVKFFEAFARFAFPLVLIKLII